WFLANDEEAEAEMDEGLQALQTLAETVVQQRLAGYFVEGNGQVAGAGQRAGEWSKQFEKLGLLREQLERKNARGQATCVANFLAACLGRRVTIHRSNGDYTAALEAHGARSNQRRFYFRIGPATAQSPANGDSPSQPTAAGDPGPAEPRTPGGDGLDGTGGTASADATSADMRASGGDDLDWVGG